MNRREVVVTLLALGVSPLPSFAQQAGRTYRLGWFAAVPRAEQAKTEPYSIAFEQRLRELGFVEGRNLVIEFRSDEGKLERLPEIAAEFARLNLDVVCCPTTEAALVAFKQATRDTPIVAVAVDFDPHVAGHIASLAYGASFASTWRRAAEQVGMILNGRNPATSRSNSRPSSTWSST